MMVIPYLIGWLLGALVVLFVGSGLLRGAVALANRSVGPVRRDEPIGWDWDADEDDEDPLPAEGKAIPEPTSGQGMRILFLAVVGHLLLGIVLNIVLDEGFRVRRGLDSPPGFFLLFVLGFLVLSWSNALILPTTFRRGALTAFYFYLILLCIGLAVGFLLFLIGR